MKRLIQAVSQPIQANILIPGSKSITNRALLLAALADGVSELSAILISDDTLALMEALRQLGIMVQYDETTQICLVKGCGGHFPRKTAAIWCADAGTVARFLIAACAASPGVYSFDGSERMRERPIHLLLNALHLQGAKIDPTCAKQMPFVLEGCESLVGGEIDINGSESSQFVSALLMVAPFAQNAMTLQTSHLVSRTYVDMTCAMMAEFGVLVRRLHQERFCVPVPQRYAARHYVIEPDLTTASYFFAAAAITGGRVTIQAMNVENSKQGDVKFLKILQKMGCQVISNAQGLTVQGVAELQGVSVDMSDSSDTFMTLAAIAPFAKTPTAITNIGHTRLQESNRIAVMKEGLAKLKVQVEEGPDWIKIYPSSPTAGTIDAHNDHRIAMSFAVLGLRVAGVEIDGAECVSKTCPEFFGLWDRLYKAHSEV